MLTWFRCKKCRREFPEPKRKYVAGFDAWMLVCPYCGSPEIYPIPKPTKRSEGCR